MSPEEIAQKVLVSVPGGPGYEARVEQAVAAALRDAHQRGVREERERCAKVAEAHKVKRPPLSKFPAESHDAILDEQRGEEIAAHEIAKAIRSQESVSGTEECARRGHDFEPVNITEQRCTRCGKWLP